MSRAFVFFSAADAANDGSEAGATGATVSSRLPITTVVRSAVDSAAGCVTRLYSARRSSFIEHSSDCRLVDHRRNADRLPYSASEPLSTSVMADSLVGPDAVRRQRHADQAVVRRRFLASAAASPRPSSLTSEKTGLLQFITYRAAVVKIQRVVD